MASARSGERELNETDRLIQSRDHSSSTSIDELDFVIPGKDESKNWRPGYNMRRNLSDSSSHGSFLTQHGTFLSRQVDVIEEDVSSIPQIDNPVTQALHHCQQTVLKPYLKLLVLIGWHPLFAEGQGRCHRFLNFVHPLFVIVLLLLGYIVQFSSCFNRNNSTKPPWSNNSNGTTKAPDPVPVCTPVVISQYLIPDILHSAAYGFCFYVFRIARSEQLVTLTERVFLQTSQTHSGFLSQAKLIRFMRYLFYFGLGWVIVSFIVQVLKIIAEHETIDFAFLNPANSLAVRIVLLIFLVIAFVMLDIVYSAVCINYMVQCSLLTYYMEGLMEKLREKTITIENAMKVMNEIEGHMKDLNDHPSSALSIVMFNFMSSFVLGASDIADGHKSNMTWFFYVITTIMSILWLIVIVVPLIMAARLSASGNRLRKMGHVIRVKPFGYQDVDDRTLDSFLQFTVSLNFRAKIFRVPVRTTYLCGILAFLGFVTLLLFQTGAVRIWLGYSGEQS